MHIGRPTGLPKQTNNKRNKNLFLLNGYFMERMIALVPVLKQNLNVENRGRWYHNKFISISWLPPSSLFLLLKNRP